MRSSATSGKRYTLPLARVSIPACNVEVTNESYRYERVDGGVRSDNDLIFNQDCESKKHPRNRRKTMTKGHRLTLPRPVRSSTTPTRVIAAVQSIVVWSRVATPSRKKNTGPKIVANRPGTAQKTKRTIFSQCRPKVATKPACYGKLNPAGLSCVSGLHAGPRTRRRNHDSGGDAARFNLAQFRAGRTECQQSGEPRDRRGHCRRAPSH
jgi:hypothetical protein